MDFAKRLRRLREDNDLTQAELGKLLNLSKQAISSYEVAGIMPNTETLERLADFFHVSVDYLLGRTDDPRPALELEKLLPQAIPLDKSKLKPVPIYGEIRAGKPMRK